MNHIEKLTKASKMNSTRDYSFICMARELGITDIDMLYDKAGEFFHEACALGLLNEYTMTKGLMTWGRA